MKRINIAVIGGGAAGCMAAVTAAEAGACVTVFEGNGQKMLCRKLGITGKGRCNLTNACGPEEFLANVPVNPKFLYAAFSAFPPEAVMEWFENRGVPLKTERGNRVFPVSDHAGDIVGALKKAVRNADVTVAGKKVGSIIARDGKFFLDGSDTVWDRVIIATGGMSYQVTGSDGSGYGLAESLGHTVKAPEPGLVPLTCDGSLCPSMQGLSLKNVTLKIYAEGNRKPVFEEFGEMLFTHFGISGPVVLTASSAVRDTGSGKYRAEIDLKPALDEKTLDARLQRELSEGANRNLSNIMAKLLPSKMVLPFIGYAGLDPETKGNSVTKEMRRRIVTCLKAFGFRITGTRPINEAIITSGGVSVSEINPKTMESKLVPGLFFAGEIIDTDAYTGGFNLQIAWSTGHLAGTCAAKERKDGAKKMKNAEIINIAIDGPSGAGKSTLAKGVAGELGISYVDTGAIYRTVGYAARQKGIDPSDPAAVGAMLREIQVGVTFGNGEQHMLLNGEDLGLRIRENEISAYASKVSAIPAVREFLMDTQRDIARNNSVVMDGRDIGTVILPDADVKIFLSATAEERAQRRFGELEEKGMPESYEKILSDIIERDERDSSRDIAPLRPAADAISFNNTGLMPEETRAAVLGIIRDRLAEKHR